VARPRCSDWRPVEEGVTMGDKGPGSKGGGKRPKGGGKKKGGK
jgi:hypothetical protein